MDIKNIENQDFSIRQINRDEIYDIKPDLAYLSINYLDERAQISSSCLLLRTKVLEISTPMSPHRSQFYNVIFLNFL